MAEAWTGQEVVAAVIATGVLSGTSSLIIDWLRGRSRRTTEGRHIALHSAIALEEFALKCAALSREITDSYGAFGDVQSQHLPAPPAYPKDCDWRLMKVEDTEKLLTFLNSISLLEGDAVHARLFENNPWELHHVAVNLGTTARDIAKYLRTSYRLPNRDYLDKLFSQGSAVLAPP